MNSFYQNKKILVIGAVGTIGSAIVKQLSQMDVQELRMMDNNESGLFFLMERYRKKNEYCFLGDIRDQEKLNKMAEGMDIIIHTAAFKHVILSEQSPFDAVQTNIIGVENVIQAAAKNGVKYVLFTSSDKAVNPTNVMGTSKLMGERLITAANAMKNKGSIFTSTRFGNVLGSRGSVVPIFKAQIKAGGPITLTDEKMTRFVMTIEEAATLVLKSLLVAKGGEVFVTKMPVVRIQDLAEVMIDMLAPEYGHDPKSIPIKIIGAKPGEKLFEELMSEEEVGRSIELEDMFAVTPAFKSIYQSIEYQYPATIGPVTKAYVSSQEKMMTKEDIRNYLDIHHVLLDEE